jgi:hypothetical protein
MSGMYGFAPYLTLTACCSEGVDVLVVLRRQAHTCMAFANDQQQ